MEEASQIKRFKWSLPYENAIIQVWGENIVELRSQKRNSHVFQRMATHLQKCGCVVNADRLKTKIHNLTTKYKKEKEKIGPSDWDLFDQVHEVLGRYNEHNEDLFIDERVPSPSSPASLSSESAELVQTSFSAAHSPPAVLYPSTTSSLSQTSYSERWAEPSSITAPAPPPAALSTPLSEDARYKKVSFQRQVLQKFDKLENEIKEQGERMEQADKELIALEKEKTAILKEYLNEFKDFKTSFVHFLDRV